jgi:hypothetical protein
MEDNNNNNNNNNNDNNDSKYHVDDDPASRYRSGEGMNFSSTKCPPGPGLENNCELPFGFLWTPMAALPSTRMTTTTTTDLPPILCVMCLAYCNLYADILQKTDHHSSSVSYWMCPFCKCENAIPSSCLSGMDGNSSGDAKNRQHHHNFNPNHWMVSPTIEFRQPLSSEQCETIVVVIDTNLPATEALAIGNTLKQVLLLSPNRRHNNNCNLGLILFGKNVHIYQLGWSAGMALCDVVATHQGWNVKQTNHNQSSSSYLTTHTNIQSVITCIAAQFGVLETTTTTTADDLNPTNNNDTNATLMTNTAKSRMQLLKERKEARLRKQQKEQEKMEDLVSMNDSLSQSKNDATATTTTDHTSSSPLLSNGGTNRVGSPWVMARQQIQSTTPPLRCTGEAIQCAIDLIMAHEESVIVNNQSHCNPRSSTSDHSNNNNNHVGVSPSRTARVLLFTNGCPNYGDGSVVDNPESYGDNDVWENEMMTNINKRNGQKRNGKEQQQRAKAMLYSIVDPGKLARASEYFTVIAKAAAEGGIGFDVFCTGSSELGLPAYQALVEPSSGYVISHDTFVTPHLQHNLRFLLEQTGMSLAHFRHEPTTNSSDDDDDDDDDDDIHENDKTPMIPQKDKPVSFGTWIEGCTVDFRMSR